MVSIRIPVLIRKWKFYLYNLEYDYGPRNLTNLRILLTPVFILSLLLAGYLGFALIHLPHDKLIHFLTFFILTMEFYFIFDTKNKSLKVLRLVTLVVCTFGASIGLEIVQSLINPARVFDVYDILFNVLGSLLGLGLSSGYQTWMVRRARLKRIRYRQLQTDVQEQSSDIDDPPNEEYVNIQMKDVGNAT